jgi:hypothetical protein
VSPPRPSALLPSPSQPRGKSYNIFRLTETRLSTLGAGRRAVRHGPLLFTPHEGLGGVLGGYEKVPLGVSLPGPCFRFRGCEPDELTGRVFFSAGIGIIIRVSRSSWFSSPSGLVQRKTDCGADISGFFSRYRL